MRGHLRHNANGVIHILTERDGVLACRRVGTGSARMLNATATCHTTPHSTCANTGEAAHDVPCVSVYTRLKMNRVDLPAPRLVSTAAQCVIMGRQVLAAARNHDAHKMPHFCQHGCMSDLMCMQQIPSSPQAYMSWRCRPTQGSTLGRAEPEQSGSRNGMSRNSRTPAACTQNAAT